MFNFYQKLDKDVGRIRTVTQNLLGNLKVFFMFNFYKKLDKDVGRICTVPQKPSRKIDFFYV